MTFKRTIIVFSAAVALVISAFQSFAQSNAQEYSLKAAFLYRFTDYVDWGNNTSDVFNIAIIGDSPITNPLVAIAKDKRVNNQQIVIRQYQNINDIPAQPGIGSYRIVFVSRNYTPGVENAVAKTKDLPVLVIGEQRNAIEKGADINFFIADNKLKFEVNMKAVAMSGLKISSQLLQHAVLLNNH